MGNHTIAVVGNCYFDEIYSISRLPEIDEKITASNLEIVMGGSATNTSCGLVELGFTTELFTILGDDEDAYYLFRQIRDKGISVENITHVSGKSGRTVILLDDNKSSTKIGYQGVCSNLANNLRFKNLKSNHITHVHLSSVSIETIHKALKYKKVKTFSLDFGAKTLQAPKMELREVLNKLDLVFFNRDILFELYQITVNDLDKINLPFDIIVTAGKDGIFAKIKSTVIHLPIIPVEVKDTTGAGDAVAAAVIYGYLNDFQPDKIVDCGIKAAAIKIQSFGGSNGHASRQQLENDERA